MLLGWSIALEDDDRPPARCRVKDNAEDVFFAWHFSHLSAFPCVVDASDGVEGVAYWRLQMRPVGVPVILFNETEV